MSLHDETPAPPNVLTIELPLPPSANRYWRHTARGGRVVTYLSADAETFKAEVAWKCNVARVRPFNGPVAVRYHVYFPTKAGDLGNREKVLSDALQGYAFADDKQIVEIHMARFVDKSRPRVEVVVTDVADGRGAA